MGIGDIFKIKQFKTEIEQLKTENQNLLNDNQNMHQQLQELGAFDYYKILDMTEQLKKEYEAKKLTAQEDFQKHLDSIDKSIAEKNSECQNILNQLEELRSQEVKLNKNVKTQTNKLNKSKELVKAINYTFDKYLNYEPSQSTLRFPENQLSELEEISPSVILKLHCMDIKDLRKAYRLNDKQIDSILQKYSARYTTKANQAIYKLMVIALRAELQNILYNLKYEKLDTSIGDVKKVTQKFLKVAAEGNQSIAGTLTKFIGEIEYLFINAVKIEYNYYVKKEQARQEQLAIREQMRQEAQERKALEAERKKVEKEESKYNTEIEKLQNQLQSASSSELEQLNARILQLQAQLSEDRVDELGNASVPFKFDVHSFIFSDDAVGLESKLHEMLNQKRVNKVNMRKEFFNVTIDELEELVTEIEPTAEFNRTMAAEEYRQSLSTTENYSKNYVDTDEDDEELE